MAGSQVVVVDDVAHDDELLIAKARDVVCSTQVIRYRYRYCTYCRRGQACNIECIFK